MYLLVLIGFINICVTYKKLKHYCYVDYITLLKPLFLIGMIVPIYEEFIFRHALLILLKYLNLGNELQITSVLFGLWHLQNYYMGMDIYTVIYQCIMSTYMGYFLYNLNNLNMAILYHMSFNTLIYLTSIVLAKLIHVKDLVDENSVDENLYKCCRNTIEQVYSSGKTKDDFHLGCKTNKTFFDLKLIKLSEQMKERYNALEKIKRKRNLLIIQQKEY